MLHYIQIFRDVQLTMYVFVIQMKELRQRVCTSTPRLNIRSTLNLHPLAHSHQAMLTSLFIVSFFFLAMSLSDLLGVRFDYFIKAYLSSDVAFFSDLLIIENHNLQATAPATTSLIPA